MTNPKKWDVNKYKSEFESEEHWQLRKKFMETHMDKFSEDKLVCLARVFFNIEFLGCRYPEKTMKLVAELSEGVAKEHREKQKGKLKRTFVQASDAAGARIKGSSTAIVDEPPVKFVKASEQRPGYCAAHVNLTKPHPQFTLSGEFSWLIIFEPCDTGRPKDKCPIGILLNSVQKSGKNNKIEFVNSRRKCEILINNKLLATGEGATPKQAKVNAAINGLKILRTMCYTIQAKLPYFTSGPSILKGDDKIIETETPETRLPQDNIGSKMMQKMGWSGCGLGRSQQGIIDPVKAAPKIMNRAGIGCANQYELGNKFVKVFKDYKKDYSTESDLVFSTEFTSEERKTLHNNLLDPESGDDLFGSDTEKDLIVGLQDHEGRNNCQTSQENLCCICCKLNSITGEESDSDIYDRMWNTGLERNYLSMMNAHWIVMNNDESPEVSQSHEKTSTANGSVTQSTNTRPITKSMSSNGLKDNVSYEDLNSIPHLNETFKEYEELQRFCSALYSQGINEPVTEKVKIFLPDGSYKRVPFQIILANEELKKFIKYSDSNSYISYKHFATVEDLKTNAALRGIFSDFLLTCKSSQVNLEVSEKHKDLNIVQENCKNHNKILTGTEKGCEIFNVSPLIAEEAFKINLNGSHNMKEENKITNIISTYMKMSTYRTSNCLVDTQLKSNNSVFKQPKNHANLMNNTQSCYKLSNEKLNKRRRLGFILPDGSRKRIPMSSIKRNPDFKKLAYKTYFTNEDFRKYKVLRHMFNEYWSKIKHKYENKQLKRCEFRKNKLNHGNVDGSM